MERVKLCLSQPGQQPQTHTDLHIYTLIVSQSEERRNSSPLTLFTQKTVSCVSHLVRSLRHGCAQEQTTAHCSSDVTPHVNRKFLQLHVINVQLKNRKEISSGVLRLHAQTTQSTYSKETLSPQQKLNLNLVYIMNMKSQMRRL